MNKLIKQEVDARQAIKDQIIKLIWNVCAPVEGVDGTTSHIERGALQRYLWDQLGLKGRPGNEFARFINKLMLEQGYRPGYSAGGKCYYGLRWLNLDTPQRHAYHGGRAKPSHLHPGQAQAEDDDNED